MTTHLKDRGMRVRIEKAVPADAEAILRLQRLAYEGEAEVYHGVLFAPLAETVDDVRAKFADHLVLKASCGGTPQIVGSVRLFLQGDTCHVGRLIVEPALQNRGIGTQLMRAAEGQLPQANRFELFTGQHNHRNIRFYEKLGYRIYKTVPRNERLHWVYMEKHRGEPAGP